LRDEHAIDAIWRKLRDLAKRAAGPWHRRA
jgi:hypothetical protein